MVVFFMKSYAIDELRFHDYDKIRAYAGEHFGFSGVDGIYWIPLDEDILSDIQKDHEPCKPFYFAVEIEPERVACELLIRTNSTIRCSCMAYADERQRNWLIRLIDGVFDELEIKT